MASLADLKRPLALTEGRLLTQLHNLIDLAAPQAELLTGLSESTLVKIQDAINRYLDHERSDLIAYVQQQQERSGG